MLPVAYDVYNFTSTILNRTKRHDDFLIKTDLTLCRIEHEVFEDRCAYLSRDDHESCFEDMEIFDYTTFLFCFGTKSHIHYYFTFAVIMLFCAYLFVILGIAADQFFCPALTALAKTLRMSESLAGVTLLAFGNGAPDLFTALANPQGDMELMYNELMGGGAFIISVIGGSIIIIRSFRVDGFTVSRDCLFFMLAITYVGYAIHDKIFTLLETSIIISVYMAYILVVLIERFCEKGNDVINVERFQPVEGAEPRSSLRQLYDSLNLFDNDGEESGKFAMVSTILQAPVIIILRLIIPIVDYTLEQDGWFKLLNMWHCIVLPQFVLLLTESIDIFVGFVPLAVIVLLASLVVIVVIGFFTSKHEAPRFHILFALLSIVGAIAVIYKGADEIMSILSVIGQATGLSDSILGITVLSWGNSVGDLVANIVLANQGYAELGFVGCFGGAMFNVLTGIGVTFILKLAAASDQVAFGRSGAMGPNCTTYLFLLLIFILIAFIMTNFWARRLIGVYMITVYVIFLIFCCLNEVEIVHPIGTDHSDQLKIQFGPWIETD